MRGANFNFNKYQIKNKINQYRQQFTYWGFKVKEVAKQVFIPLAVLQLIRTILVPTPFDVFVLVAIFIFIIVFLLDWV